MSDNLMAYHDPNRDAVIVCLESGSEIAVLDLSEAECLGDEILAASRGESTGYEEFLAQQGVEGFEQYLDESGDADLAEYQRPEGEPLDAETNPFAGEFHPDEQTCPSCGQQRRFAIARNSFLPGTACGHCGHVEGDIEVEQGPYLIALSDGGDISITDEHGNTVDVFRIDATHEAEGWDSYAETLRVTRADVQAALDAQARAEEDEEPQGACILTAANMSTEDDCTTHDHEPVPSGTGTPWSDSPVHAFAEPDPEVVAAGEAEPGRCNECGETEDHWKHHTADPSLDA